MSLYIFSPSYKETLTSAKNEAVTGMLKNIQLVLGMTEIDTPYNLKKWGVQVLKTKKQTNGHHNKTFFLAL